MTPFKPTEPDERLRRDECAEALMKVYHAFWAAAIRLYWENTPASQDKADFTITVALAAREAARRVDAGRWGEGVALFRRLFNLVSPEDRRTFYREIESEMTLLGFFLPAN